MKQSEDEKSGHSTEFEDMVPYLEGMFSFHAYRLPAKMDLRAEFIQEATYQAYRIWNKKKDYAPYTLARFAISKAARKLRLFGYMKNVRRSPMCWKNNPAALVEFNLDWAAFRERLSDEKRTIVNKLADGWKKIEIAKLLNLSKQRIQQLCQEIAGHYAAMFGTPHFV